MIGIFRDYGYRRLRHRARLKFLVADWGRREFREVLEKEYLGYALPDGPAPVEPADGRRDHVGVHPQQDGSFYVGFAPTVGRLSGTKLAQIADLAEAHGSGRVRTTAEQKMVILDVPPDRVDSLVGGSGGARPAGRARARSGGRPWRAPASSSASSRSSRPRPGPMTLIDELERRLPDFDSADHDQRQRLPELLRALPDRRHRPEGIAGHRRRGRAGRRASRCTSAAASASTPSFGRKVRGLKVTADELEDYVERLANRYLEQRADGERFTQWVHRADEADLQ